MGSDMTEHEEVSEVKKLYKELCNQEPRGVTIGPLETQYRVAIVSRLENILNTDFHHTEDLHAKVRAYLGNRNTPHIALRKYRKSCGHSQSLMAEILGVTRRHYIRMEKGDNPLNKKALGLVYKKIQ